MNMFKGFKTLTESELDFKNKSRQSTALVEHGKILEQFAHLLSQNGIENADQLTEEIAIQLVNSLKKKDHKLNENKFIVLDTSNLNDSSFMKYLDSNRIEHEVVKKNGPAAGYPIVKYTGSEENLKKMYLRFWDKNGVNDFYEFLDKNYY